MSRFDLSKSTASTVKANLDSTFGLISENLGIGTATDKLTSFNDFNFRRINPEEARRIYANSDKGCSSLLLFILATSCK